MANAQLQSQREPLGVTAMGALAKATLSATCDWLLSYKGPAPEVASIHKAPLPLANNVRFSLKPLALAPGGPSAFMRSTYNVMAFFHSGVLMVAFHLSSNQVHPKVLRRVST